MSATLIYSAGPPITRPHAGPSHRGTTSTERDSIEHRPMPMPTVRKPRAAKPWHNVDRDPTGGRHRPTVGHDSDRVLDLASSALDECLALLGGAA